MTKKLFISQPAVTQAIKKLEEEIGFKLFYRTKKGMNLTEEGEILYNYLKLYYNLNHLFEFQDSVLILQ